MIRKSAGAGGPPERYHFQYIITTSPNFRPHSYIYPSEKRIPQDSSYSWRRRWVVTRWKGCLRFDSKTIRRCDSHFRATEATVLIRDKTSNLEGKHVDGILERYAILFYKLLTNKENNSTDLNIKITELERRCQVRGKREISVERASPGDVILEGHPHGPA